MNKRELELSELGYDVTAMPDWMVSLLYEQVQFHTLCSLSMKTGLYELLPNVKAIIIKAIDDKCDGYDCYCIPRYLACADCDEVIQKRAIQADEDEANADYMRENHIEQLPAQEEMK